MKRRFESRIPYQHEIIEGMKKKKKTHIIYQFYTIVTIIIRLLLNYITLFVYLFLIVSELDKQLFHCVYAFRTLFAWRSSLCVYRSFFICFQ